MPADGLPSDVIVVPAQDRTMSIEPLPTIVVPIDDEGADGKSLEYTE